jgi:hypothetical protein
MKAKIRAKLYANHYPVQSQIVPRRVSLTKPKDEGLPKQVIDDHQTEEEVKQREMAAKVEAFRFQKRLNEARADGSRCSVKACPFPAVLDGECRSHAIDRHAQVSLMPSQLILAADAANIMGY